LGRGSGPIAFRGKGLLVTVEKIPKLRAVIQRDAFAHLEVSTMAGIAETFTNSLSFAASERPDTVMY
jgi:hypothetical protein